MFAIFSFPEILRTLIIVRMDAEATEAEDVQKIKVVFLGDRSVGKTSIIKRFTRDEFTEKQNVSGILQQPTIGIEYMFKTLSYRAKKYRMELWDTAGQEKYRSLVRNYLRDADCALFIYDVNCNQRLIQSHRPTTTWWTGLIPSNRASRASQLRSLSGIKRICGSKTSAGTAST